jgi:ADP-ribose pyrophosphatase
MDESKLIETKISSKDIFCGKIMTVQLDTVKLPNGKEATREIIRHKGAVCILPLAENGDVIVERQFRYPLNTVLLEIPAGKLDFVGEDPLEAAKRELREETGVTANKMTYLGEYVGSPAMLDEKIHMYLAEELLYGECDYDEDEFMSLDRIPLDELVEMILKGEVPDGKTQAAALRVYAMKQKEKNK